MEATQNRKNNKKKREGEALLSFIPHLCFRVAPVLQFVESFPVVLALSVDPYTIELGLHIPRMSLLKRALGLHEKASWMHPH